MPMIRIGRILITLTALLASTSISTAQQTFVPGTAFSAQGFNRWLGNFWHAAWGRAIVTADSALVGSWDGNVLNISEFRISDEELEAYSNGILSDISQIADPTIQPSPDNIAATQFSHVEQSFLIGHLSTTTGYSKYVLFQAMEYQWLTEDVLSEIVSLAPLSEHATHDAAMSALYRATDAFIPSFEAHSNLCGPSAAPGTPLGDWCQCTEQAKDRAISRQLGIGGIALFGSSACLLGLACPPPISLLCVGGCEALVVAGTGLVTAQNISDFHADIDQCDYTLCTQDSAYCP